MGAVLPCPAVFARPRICGRIFGENEINASPRKGKDMNYIIMTDTGCDINRERLAEWGIEALSLTFRFTDDNTEYTEADMPIGDFYSAMRAGRVAKTAAVNTETFRTAFESVLKTGKDLIYIGFSSGLSSTYNSARMAAESLREAYPERTVVTVDSLAASAGQGLLVYLAAKHRDEGASISELESYVRELAPKISAWFTVEDLVYLKRGGRVSAAAAFFGNLLGIKPVLHVDDAGKLIPVLKVRGRRTSITTLVDKYGETALDPSSGTVFISCADCHPEAEQLREEIQKRYGVNVELITDIGAVIGSHSGPGTIALFFVARER